MRILKMRVGNFRRRAGEVTMAQPLWAEVAPERKSLRGMSQAQKLGLRYEEKAIEFLYRNVPTFVDHLPFKFYSTLDAGRAIPDGIIYDKASKTITIVEIKYRHSLEAYFQLREFYLPIVSKAFTDHRVTTLEVCKNYDPGVKLPGSVTLSQNFKDTLKSPETYNVLILSDKH